MQHPDPLFHPVKSGQCAMLPEQVRLAVKEQSGNSLALLDQTYAPELAQMGNVLNFAKSAYCKRSTAAGKGREFAKSLPDALVVSDDGERLSFDGALGLSSMLSEIFVLQRAQGMPEVAWGRIRTAAQWNALLKLHNAQFNLLTRAPYIARHRGTPLLQTIAAALEPHAQGEKHGQVTLPSAVLFLGGHDTNIANIAGLLGVSWTLPGQPDDTSPGGTLVFERWHDVAHDRQFVTVTMVYQTLAQLGEQTPLSLEHPPGSVKLQLSGCEGEDARGFCPLSSFTQLVDRRIEPTCALGGSGRQSSLVH